MLFLNQHTFDNFCGSCSKIYSNFRNWENMDISNCCRVWKNKCLFHMIGLSRAHVRLQLAVGIQEDMKAEVDEGVADIARYGQALLFHHAQVSLICLMFCFLFFPVLQFSVFSSAKSSVLWTSPRLQDGECLECPEIRMRCIRL